MNFRDALLGLAILSILTNVVIYILIIAALDRRGYKTNFLLVRLFFFKYLSAYKEATLKETGKPGRLYNLSILTLLLALVAALAGLLIPRA
jgi:hypothetical protein